MSRVWFWFALFVVPLLAAGCGSGSSTVTQLPQTLAITAASPEVGVDQPFTSSLGAPAAGLSLSWDFGDGSAPSNAASPTHRFASSGDYTIRLSVSNEAGDSIRAERVVSVRRMAWVAGMVCAGPQQSGWCTKPPPFRDVGDPQFFGSSTVFRLGTIGWIGNDAGWIGSDDGGQTFTPRLPAAGAVVVSVYAADAQSAWMVWKDAEGTRRLSRTGDGGRTWATLRTLSSPGREYLIKGTGQRLLLYLIINCTSGKWFECVSNQTELSPDGGASWAVLPLSLHYRHSRVTPSGSVTWVNCLSTSTGYCTRVSELNAYSAEAGIQGPPSAFPFPGRAGLRAESGDTLLQFVYTTTAGPEGVPIDLVLWRSSDGGRTWSTLPVPPDPSLPQGQFFGYSFEILQRRCGTALCERLQIIAGTQRFTSIDSGATWQVGPLGYPSFDALGDLLLDAAGKRVSVDAGASWQSLPPSSAPDSTDTLVPSGGALWLIDRRWLGNEAQVYRSTDGGRTWALAWIRRFALSNIDSAWVFADGRAVAHSSAGTFESSDQGSSWSYLGSAYVGVQRTGFFDASTGFAAGRSAETSDYLNPTFIGSSDGGRSWTTLALPRDGLTNYATSALQAMADGTRWLVGDEQGQPGSALWRRAAAATQWERIGAAPAARDYRSLQFTSASRGFILSQGGLHRTVDAGKTWQALPLPADAAGRTIAAMFFADDRVGWLVGSEGLILHTRDGGGTWAPQATGTTESYIEVGALDTFTVWVRSAGGSFLYSATAGL